MMGKGRVAGGLATWLLIVTGFGWLTRKSASFISCVICADLVIRVAKCEPNHAIILHGLLLVYCTYDRTII